MSNGEAMFFIMGSKGGQAMIYAIQIQANQERKICDLINATVSKELYTECFWLRQERSKKRNGRRIIVCLPLFTGYLFMNTDQIEEVMCQLKNIPELTKVLGIGQEIVPLSEEDNHFIARGGADHIYRINKGFMRGDYVQIEEGAFAGYYGKMEKVNRHNRYGIMRTNLFEREIELEIGLLIYDRV